MSNNLKTIIGTMRLPFLVLTPACILLGYAFALMEVGNINYYHLGLVLLGGLSAHISVNVFNEYMDFSSGLDFKTIKTPFSGGSGSLPESPEVAKKSLMLAIVTLLITMFVGFYFIYLQGWAIAPLGLLGLIIIVAYTNHLTRSPILCLIAPGLSFGPLMVMGTYFVLTGNYSLTVALVSLVPFFLVNNLLLLNQYPDIDADKAIGRFHIPIAFGKETSNKIFFIFYLFAYLVLIALSALNFIPLTSLLGLLTMPIAYKVIKIMNENSNDIEKLMPAMGMNVAINIFTPTLIGLGGIWASFS